MKYRKDLFLFTTLRDECQTIAVLSIRSLLKSWLPWQQLFWRLS